MGEDELSERSDNRRRHSRDRGSSRGPYHKPERSRGPRGYGSSGDEALLGKDEVIKVEILPQDDNWGENTTCVTGNTSERSYSCEDISRLTGFRGRGDLQQPAEAGLRMRCARLFWVAIAGLLTFIAFISPLLMVILPKALQPTGVLSPNWNTTACTTVCESSLLYGGVKMLGLLVAVWALFFRRALADLPRLFIGRAFLLAFVFIVTFAFWLFYGVRIFQKREMDYDVIVSFSSKLLESLLIIHYLGVVLLLLRHQRTEYKIHIVRSPDGQSKTYNVGQLSIQRAAVALLQEYYREFPVYNPYLMRLPGGSSRMRMKGGRDENRGGSVTNGPSFKIYNLDGGNGPSDAIVSNSNAQALMMAAARKRDSGHNERFYEEIDWERRVRKRKARLLTAAEEAFNHIKKLQEEKGPCIPMDPQSAAQAIFPSFARTLSKYLRVTRQQPRHNAEQVINHLGKYLSFDMGPRSFLERFFNSEETFENGQNQTKWSIVCEHLASREISHGTVFQLRCHSPGPDAGVMLLCTVSKLPFFNLTEEVIDAKSNKFVLRMNSETSV